MMQALGLCQDQACEFAGMEALQDKLVKNRNKNLLRCAGWRPNQTVFSGSTARQVRGKPVLLEITESRVLVGMQPGPGFVGERLSIGPNSH